MKTFLKSLAPMAVVAIAVIMLAAPSQVQAQCANGTCGGGFGGVYGNGVFGGFSSPYATDRIPTPPYFALHPPVYYSVPVPRTYGYSPIAYGGNVRTPDIAPAANAPLSIVNPYVTQPAKAEVKAEKKPADGDTAIAKPLMIVNPFVKQKDASDIRVAQN